MDVKFNRNWENHEIRDVEGGFVLPPDRNVLISKAEKVLASRYAAYPRHVTTLQFSSNYTYPIVEIKTRSNESYRRELLNKYKHRKYITPKR